MFDGFSIWLNGGIFCILAACVWLAGTRLSYLIDAIAEQTNLARAFLGLIILASATELPELVTTLTAASRDTPSLALNNMFGGMLMQLAVLAIADIFVLKGTLTSCLSKPTPVIAGLFLVLSLSFMLGLQLFGDQTLLFHVGLGSLITAGIYVLAMYFLQMSQNHQVWSPVDLPDDAATAGGQSQRHNQYDERSMRYLVIGTAICAAVIFVCGALLVNLAETLAEQTALGTSFVGITLLSFTTSMPELSTSIAAVRVKAYSMAISNIFGSNLIMTFLIFPVDIVFTGGPVMNEMDASATFALAAGIALTAIYCLGLMLRPTRKILGMGIDSFLVLMGYVIAVYLLYQLR